MREAALWVLGAALAFFVTAAAFLVLANLATAPPEKNLAPGAATGKPGPALGLGLNKERLASLEAKPDQKLNLNVENTGDRDFSDVNLTLEVSSGDTAHPQTRYYRRTVKGLDAGKEVDVRFRMDLSQNGATARNSSTGQAEPMKILEVRATTPQGASAVKTAIVPL